MRGSRRGGLKQTTGEKVGSDFSLEDTASGKLRGRDNREELLDTRIRVDESIRRKRAGKTADMAFTLLI